MQASRASSTRHSAAVGLVLVLVTLTLVWGAPRALASAVHHPVHKPGTHVTAQFVTTVDQPTHRADTSAVLATVARRIGDAGFERADAEPTATANRSTASATGIRGPPVEAV
jgi:hypothetical protein